MWPLGAHGVPRGLWGGPRELQRCLWGRPGGSRDEGSRPRRTPGAPPKLKMSGLAQNVINILVLVIFNKTCVLLNEAQLDFQEGPGRAPKRVFGALARSQGALGTRVQVHGACLGGRLDRQEFARAQLLREIPSVF